MKNILIIYPHWPPSNLVGAMRPRLISNFLHEFKWHPIILTVKSEFYEEKLDWSLIKTVHSDTEVIKVNAFKVIKKPFRLIGDIGLRAFFQLLKGAKNIIKNYDIQFIYIPIPSFYPAILGRLLYNKFKIPYGIDYIDPWSDGLPGSNKLFSRAWFAKRVALLLEPFAIKKVVLISGVSESYFKYVFNSFLKNKEVFTVGIPYGFDKNDYKIIINNIPKLWDKQTKAIIYAGAFLPNSELFIKALFKAVKNLIELKKWDTSFHFYFIGTGPYKRKTIMEYSYDYGVEQYVTEIHSRFKYLETLNLLSNSFAVNIIGRTDKYYTASKIFQSILSKRPVFAILNKESSAVNILQLSKADRYLIKYDEKMDVNKLINLIRDKLEKLINEGSKNWKPKAQILDNYSAKKSTEILVNKINKAIQLPNV